MGDKEGMTPNISKKKESENERKMERGIVTQKLNVLPQGGFSPEY